MKTCTNVPSMPKGGPYSHCVQAGDLLFVSGSTAFDSATGKMIKGDIPAATRLILSNIERILKEAGSDLSKVVKTTVFLTDMGAFSAMNAAYGEVFKENPPARSTVGVKELPGGFDIEIEAVATR